MYPLRMSVEQVDRSGDTKPDTAPMLSSPVSRLESALRALFEHSDESQQIDETGCCTLVTAVNKASHALGLPRYSDPRFNQAIRDLGLYSDVVGQEWEDGEWIFGRIIHRSGRCYWLSTKEAGFEGVWPWRSGFYDPWFAGVWRTTNDEYVCNASWFTADWHAQIEAVRLVPSRSEGDLSIRNNVLTGAVAGFFRIVAPHVFSGLFETNDEPREEFNAHCSREFSRLYLEDILPLLGGSYPHEIRHSADWIGLYRRVLQRTGHPGALIGLFMEQANPDVDEWRLGRLRRGLIEAMPGLSMSDLLQARRDRIQSFAAGAQRWLGEQN